MNGNPAGAGYDDDPRRRLRIAAGETGLCESGLTSYSVSVPVCKAFTADARRQTFDVLDRETHVFGDSRHGVTWCKVAPYGAKLGQTATLRGDRP